MAQFSTHAVTHQSRIREKKPTQKPFRASALGTTYDCRNHQNVQGKVVS